MLTLLKDIYQRRELLFVLIDRNLKIRYKNSVLGFFWSLLTPIFLILIYATFAGILKFGGSPPDYLQFLIVGIIVWQFLSMCLNDSLSAIMGNANLIKKTAFPRFILPVATVLANLINFLLTFVILVAYLLIVGMPFSHLGWLPLILMTQCALCLGMALIISTVNVFFRDAEHILQVLTLAWFFLTPIFYPIDRQMEILHVHYWLAFLNPMTGIICGYRLILMSVPDPGLSFMAISFVAAWLTLLIGALVFQKFQIRFADEL